jgi:hypothetical protein
MWILWPSFLVAIPASGVYFSLFDPVDLDFFNMHIVASRNAAYTLGFFAFWLLGAASSALTLLLSIPEKRMGA